MAEMVPTHLDRVRDNTSDEVNTKIDSEIESRIRIFALQSDQAKTAHIQALEAEWDIERTLEATASTFAFVGTLLGAFVNPWFLLIPGIVTAFLFQHAVQGWCPPLPVFRRLGKRTRNEIDVEKFAMKTLRGDFAPICRSADRLTLAERVIEAVRAY